jgi:hypothetical protein
MAIGRLDRPAIVHRLGAVLRFVDAFSAVPVRARLEVRVESLPVVAGMPGTPWNAVPGRGDGTYRLMVSGGTVLPVGAIAVTVSAPGREYVNFEPFTVALPRPLVAHPPTPARSDFLVERPLWPTRSLKVPPGETAIVGRVSSTGGTTAVARLRVKLWPSGSPMPASPYAYTDDAGEFLFRLPALTGSVSGGVVVSTADLALDVRLPPAYVTPVAPTAPAIPFTVSLGQASTLQIDVP